jgi:O-acetyl-ADP-ribose deacetylase (regulator of RNase III)
MKTVKGDIVALAKAGEFDVVVHGCNCFHTMGAGVALQLATEFAGRTGPLETDIRQTAFGDRDKLGTYTIANGFRDDGTPFAIVNAYTQYGTANADNTSPVDYDAIRDVFRKLSTVVLRNSIRIGYPAIGAGLAGGDWDRIAAIIDEELVGLDHTFVEYVPAAPKVDPRKQVAQRLRDACNADIYCDTSGWDDEDDWVTQIDSQIEDAISAMSDAADLLDPLT